ncbi:hypothetical protein ACZ87_01676 [Candidatus Erwinia dacicola]|uniref:Uncharacterized protein n=1 Tax=Candidatus Erwinia dacicola TaxID=252393 RepID=A0A328TUP7_9GAMM|nr:hypothetical protein ACZ87_01676 [Candidatus Erwinia dacicola]
MKNMILSSAVCPNQKWVTDVTEFSVNGEKTLFISDSGFIQS